MLCSDYPRGLANCRWLWQFPGLDPLPIALVLPLAFLLAPDASAVPLLGFPPQPFPRSGPAALAAIALPHLSGSKPLFAPLEQTATQPRSAYPALPPAGRLNFATECRILERAHGRLRLPEAHALERNLVLSGAQPASGAHYQINTVMDNGRRLRFLRKLTSMIMAQLSDYLDHFRKLGVGHSS